MNVSSIESVSSMSSNSVLVTKPTQIRTQAVIGPRRSRASNGKHMDRIHTVFNPHDPKVARRRERSAGINRIAPQSGASFKMHRGQILRVYDPCGEQVADLFAFKDGDLSCSLSSGRSIDYASKIFLSIGDVLYSNDSRRMFTIVGDTVGRHDFLLTPCSQQMFEILHKCEGHHPSCFENLCNAFQPHGVKPEQISTTFNIFMNVKVDAGGQVSVEPPRSKPGDFIEQRADMDMVCALTACSAEQSNNGTFKPIDYEVVTLPCN